MYSSRAEKDPYREPHPYHAGGRFIHDARPGARYHEDAYRSPPPRSFRADRRPASNGYLDYVVKCNLYLEISDTIK